MYVFFSSLFIIAATGKEPTATGLGLYQARVEKQTSFIIETLGVTAQAFVIFVTGPGNEAIPVRWYQQKDKNLLAEFKPLCRSSQD